MDPVSPPPHDPPGSTVPPLETREQFRARIRTLARRVIAPLIRDLDAREAWDPTVLQELRAAGLLGLCLPRRLGGGGLSYHHLGIACEELERIDTFARVILSVHLSLNSLALYQWGTPEQQQRWLIPQARGERVAAFALTEPQGGTDAAALTTRAERLRGGYRLTGEKAWIGLAGVAEHFLVFARVEESGGTPVPGARGVAAFLIDRAAPGLETESITGKHGLRAGNVGRLRLQGVFVPEEDRLGEEHEGFHVAMAALDNGRYGVAAGSLGIIEACLEACVERCRTRRTLGEELGRRQLVQQIIARMVSARDIGRLLVEEVGRLKCLGVRHTREVSLAKWVNCDAAHRSADDAVQIFGADGFSNEWPVERHLRNCRAALIYEGTREIHQVIQAEYALGYRADRPLRRTLPPYPFPEDRPASHAVCS